MADWTAKHLTEGYWSADSIFLSALKYGGQPEDLVRVATPFGGGMGRKDLCGYLTGGLMAIGLFAGAKTGSDRAARQRCNRLSKEYQDWWAKSYPLHCAEINKSQAESCDYKAMGAKVSEFLALDRLTFLDREGQAGCRHRDDGAQHERMDYLELIARVTSQIQRRARSWSAATGSTPTPAGVR